MTDENYTPKTITELTIWGLCNEVAALEDIAHGQPETVDDYGLSSLNHLAARLSDVVANLNEGMKK